jgi:hypothetical protein
MIYDIFYISENTVNDLRWKSFSKKFPSARKLENVKSFNDIKVKSFTKFFWIVWDDLEIVNDFVFDYRIPKWDEEYIHVYKNGKYYDGVGLFPKNITVSDKEFKNRFFIAGKKEMDIIASNPYPFDIFFMSYSEPNADENYKKLCDRFPRAKRVHGVKGIHQAHIKAAELSETEMFWVVDADAEIVPEFKFEFEQLPFYDRQRRDNFLETVHVWTSKNPVNHLRYGYGGVKLLPKKLTLEMNTSKPDMTTSISDKFQVMKQVSNITAFNIDEFSTWRSAFRECVKLSSKSIDRNYDQETETRLKVWCTVGKNQPFGIYSIGGALAGYRYGTANVGDMEALTKINNFDWLMEEYNAWLPSLEAYQTANNRYKKEENVK